MAQRWRCGALLLKASKECRHQQAGELSQSRRGIIAITREAPLRRAPRPGALMLTNVARKVTSLYIVCAYARQAIKARITYTPARCEVVIFHTQEGYQTAPSQAGAYKIRSRRGVQPVESAGSRLRTHAQKRPAARARRAPFSFTE